MLGPYPMCGYLEMGPLVVKFAMRAGTWSDRIRAFIRRDPRELVLFLSFSGELTGRRQPFAN